MFIYIWFGLLANGVEEIDDLPVRIVRAPSSSHMASETQNPQSSPFHPISIPKTQPPTKKSRTSPSRASRTTKQPSKSNKIDRAVLPITPKLLIQIPRSPLALDLQIRAHPPNYHRNHKRNQLRRRNHQNQFRFIF